MKKIIVLLFLFPVLCHAQKFYLQGGGGFLATFYASGNGYLLEMNTGIKLGSIVRLGIGAAYLKYNNFDQNAYVPVYVDFKLVGRRKFKPYIFLQPGYGFYKSTPILYMSNDPNKPTQNLYFYGGLTCNTGFGVIYKYAYLQIGFRMTSTTLKIPAQDRTYNSDYLIGFTAGFNFPW